MSKFKDVTDNQGLGIARMARAKRVPRQLWVIAEEDGTFSRILDAIRDGKPIIAGTSVIPPIGGRIHTIKVRNLHLDREWQEAVSDAGPNTGGDLNVRKVGDLYLPTGTGVVEEEEHILLNYPNGDGSLDRALFWAAQFKLVPNDPRRVFGMAEQHPNLHHEVGTNLMYVVAPVTCTFGGRRQACSARWNDAKREASLDWTGLFDEAHDWFSFRPLAQTGK